MNMLLERPGFCPPPEPSLCQCACLGLAAPQVPRREPYAKPTRAWPSSVTPLIRCDINSMPTRTDCAPWPCFRQL